MEDELARAVREAVADHGRLTVAIDSVGETDSLYTAGLTSHASVNVMMALEDRYDREFPEHLLRRETFESLQSLTAALVSIVDSSDPQVA